MDEKERLKIIYECISEIVDSFLTDIWITPYYHKRYIPSENIHKLKEKLAEEFTKKGGPTNGKTKKN